MSRFLRPLDITLTGRDRVTGFTPAWQAARAAADASASSVLRGRDVTDRECGWGHNYFCPVHSNALEFVEDAPDRHRCAEFDHLVTGEQFDTGWAYSRNLRLMDHLTASAVAAAVTGNERDVARAIEILTGLAEVYPSLPLHGTKVGQAKLMHQSLEEAVAATSLTRSFALVEQWLSPQQHSLVGNSLFRPMVTVIEDHLMHRAHNIEVWHLSGLASLAVVLDDPELALSTWQREHGMRSQLAEGLRGDGWWYEGSPGYHFYMLTAVLDAVQAYRAIGLATEADDHLEQMLLTPVRGARNDLTVPTFNDSHLDTAVPPGLAVHAELYLQGARLCQSAELQAFLDSPLAASFDRASIAHLLYGQETPAAPGRSHGWPTARTDVFPDSGYAVLRQTTAQAGEGPDTAVHLKFGPHGGSHGHPDKLEIELMVDGARVVVDPATTMYTNPIHQPWYVQTWAHSTVVVDRISQPPISGRLLGHRQVGTERFGCVEAEVVFKAEVDAEGADLVWHDIDPAPVAAYAGVTMRRMLIMVPPEHGNYLLDLVFVTSPHPSTIDLITHVRGTRSGTAGRPAPSRVLLPQFADVCRLPEAAGRSDYQLSDSQISDGDRQWRRWHTGADETYTAVTPSNPTHESCASTIERVVGRQARLAAVLPLTADCPVTGIEHHPGGVTVNVGEETHRWEVPESGGAAWSEPPVQWHRA